MIQSIKIPLERVGVLIGRNGQTKSMIERRTGVAITIDSEEGDVQIDSTHAKDPGAALSVLSVVQAIGRGFAPDKAIRLLEEDSYLEVLDIRDYVGKKHEHVVRMRARVIGTRGRTRALIEELTGAYVSVYGNTVSIIGDPLQLEIARKALDMLLSGSEHAAVYHFLEGRRALLKIDAMGF